MKPPQPPSLVCDPCWMHRDIFQQDPTLGLQWGLLCRLSPSGPCTSPSSGCSGLSSIFPGLKVFAEMMEIGMISTKLLHFWQQIASCKEWGKSCLVWGLSWPEKLMHLNKYPLRDQLIPRKSPLCLDENCGHGFWAPPSQLLQDISASVVFHKSSLQASAPTSHLSPALPPPATPICSCSLDF